jgi:protein TonB
VISLPQWLVAISAALALHGLALLPLLQPAASDGAREAGVGGLEVGLGMAGSYADIAATQPLVSDAELEPVAAPQAPAPAVPPTAEVVAAAPEVALKAVTAAVDEAAIVVATPPKARPQPEPAPEVAVRDAPATLETAETPSSEARVATPAADSQAVVSSVAAPARQRGAGEGSRSHRSGGRVGDVQGYFSQISAWIDANKDYPGEVKKRKQQGTVTVRFSINRDGELLNASVRKSSGHALLDQAALATLARASPFPPIPAFMNRQTLSIVVPIDYSLIQNQFGDRS